MYLQNSVYYITVKSMKNICYSEVATHAMKIGTFISLAYDPLICSIQFFLFLDTKFSRWKSSYKTINVLPLVTKLTMKTKNRKDLQFPARTSS